MPSHGAQCLQRVATAAASLAGLEQVTDSWGQEGRTARTADPCRGSLELTQMRKLHCNRGPRGNLGATLSASPGFLQHLDGWATCSGLWPHAGPPCLPSILAPFVWLPPIFSHGLSNKDILGMCTTEQVQFGPRSFFKYKSIVFFVACSQHVEFHWSLTCWCLRSHDSWSLQCLSLFRRPVSIQHSNALFPKWRKPP